MKDLLKSNIYDVDETIIIVGSCLPNMDKKAYEKLSKISDNIYDLCLESSHINMAITKVGGMLRTGKVRKIIFATVNKSPHCIQVHYIQDELRKMMNLDNIEIINYVADSGNLIEISKDTISLSKDLVKLEKEEQNAEDN